MNRFVVLQSYGAVLLLLLYIEIHLIFDIANARGNQIIRFIILAILLVCSSLVVRLVFRQKIHWKKIDKDSQDRKLM